MRESFSLTKYIAPFDQLNMESLIALDVHDEPISYWSVASACGSAYPLSTKLMIMQTEYGGRFTDAVMQCLTRRQLFFLS